MIALALDGPFNGEYINELTAELGGYSKAVWWLSGELVWLQSKIGFAEPEEFNDTTT